MMRDDTDTQDHNDSGDENDADESDTAENTADEDDAGEASDDSNDTDGEGSSDEESDTADDDEEDDGSEDDDEEPPTRGTKKKSNADYVAERRARKIEKLKKGQQNDRSKDDADSDDDGEDTDDEDDDGLSPEDAKAIDRRIAKAIKPFQEKTQEQQVDGEIAEFVAQNPDFKPFAAKARRWALHPNRAGVPVKSIFYEVAGDKLLKIGANRAKEADAKSKQTRGVGGQNDTNKGTKSYKDMPLSDFGKELDAAKLRR